MIRAKSNSNAELLALAPSIKNNMMEWQIVHMKMQKDSPLSQEDIINRLITAYKTYDGIIFASSDTQIIMIIRLGIVENYVVVKKEIEKNIPGHVCRIMLRKMSTMGMKQIQIDLMQKNTSIDLIDDLYTRRVERKKNVIMIADDDAFVRKSMCSLLAACGEIQDVDTGEKVTKAYLKHNPDFLLLDIHMPGKTGLEIIEEIMEFDADAFIIVLSADSSSDNVLNALNNGASGFLTKPPSQEKIQDYLNKCITIY